MTTITLPLDEYEFMVQQVEAIKTAHSIVITTPGKGYYWQELTILNREETIDRLDERINNLMESYSIAENRAMKLKQENAKLINRNLWQRIINKSS